MNDLAIAVAQLDGHSICLCKDGEFFTDDKRGIAPMMSLIGQGRDLRGFSVADIIVGKAAALLFIKAGIAAVYGKVTSSAALDTLKAAGIPCTYETLTGRIINRSGTDICPMEKTVADISDPEAAYTALAAKLEKIRKGENNV
jgi:hypothetical protein